LLSSLDSNQKLFLIVPNDKNYISQLKKEYTVALSLGRVEIIIQNAPVFTDHDGERILNLGNVAESLASYRSKDKSPLNKTQLQNMMVLIPEGVSWSPLIQNSSPILDLVSFALFRDFISGVEIARVDVTHIEKLARVLAIQS
jgi:hypothetical protein